MPYKGDLPGWRCTVPVDGQPCGRAGIRKGKCKAHFYSREPKAQNKDVLCHCGRPARCKGLCQTHYRHVKLEGKPGKLPIKEKLLKGRVSGYINVRLYPDTWKFIRAHAKARRLSQYMLLSEVLEGWVQQRRTEALEEHNLEDVDLLKNERQQQLKELLESRHYGVTKLDILDLMEEHYPDLLTRNSPSEKKLYRDLAVVPHVKIHQGTTPIYIHPRHAHRRDEEID